MKKLVLLLLLFAIHSNAQLIRPIIGIGYNRQSVFEKNAYFNIKSGIELNLKKYIKPEIEVNYFIGDLGEFTNITDQGIVADAYKKTFTAVNFGFSPKIIIGKHEDAFYYFQITPKYNYTSIKATGDYYLINQNDIKKSINEIEILKANKHSIGIGAGIVFDFKKGNKSNAIAVNLMYQNIDAGSLITQLKHNKAFVNTKDVFSLQIDYYLNISEK